MGTATIVFKRFLFIPFKLRMAEDDDKDSDDYEDDVDDLDDR